MLQLTKEQFNRYVTENPDKLRMLVKPVLQHREELYRRYSRKEDSTQTMHGMGKIQPFEYYIVKMAKGYLAGKEPTYNVTGKNKRKSKAYSETISEIRKYNDDGTLYSDLMHDYLTTAAAYLYVYENEENKIVYSRFDSRQTAAIYDYSIDPSLLGVVRIWNESTAGDTSVEVMEIVTDTERVQWREGQRTVIETLQWGDVPCAAAEEKDGIAIFEPAIADIDTYEQMKTNIASMTQYNDNAKLLLVGYTIPGETEEEKKTFGDYLYASKVLTCDPDGDIKWLLKDVDYSGILDVLKEDHDGITMLTGVPNMTDEAFASADNASALGYKLYALDQYSADTDRVFKKAYLRLWEIITGRLNMRGKAFDWRDIDITMQRNLPTDRDKSIDRAVKMKNSGLFADETCITESQVEVDPEDERQKVEAQEEAEYQKMVTRGLTEESDELPGRSQ